MSNRRRQYEHYYRRESYDEFYRKRPRLERHPRHDPGPSRDHYSRPHHYERHHQHPYSDRDYRRDHSNHSQRRKRCINYEDYGDIRKTVSSVHVY